MSIIARDDDFPIFMVGTNSPARQVCTAVLSATSIVRIIFIIIIIRLFKLGSSLLLMRAHSGIFFTFISEALLNILKV